MLYLLVFLTLLVSTNQELMGVNYSFGVDFYKHFDTKGCGNENLWQLVRYEEVGVEPYTKNGQAIKAVGECCVSSFPIIFLGGTIQINVYISEFSQNPSIIVEVFSDDDRLVSRFTYGSLSESFRPGWSSISFEIDKQDTGFIKFLGRSFHNETVLLDSFKYIPSSTIHDGHKKSRSVNNDNEDATEIIFDSKVHSNQDLIDRFEGSGDQVDGSGDVDDNSPSDKNTEPKTTFWNPLTICFVTLGVVVFLAILGVSAYYVGKMRAMNEVNPQIFIHDIEPPRRITIPRVTGTYDNFY